MKFNTKIIKKIAMLLVIVTICNFIIPNTVAVAASTSWLAKAGGNLLSVILDFFVFIGDGIMNVLQNNFISSQKVIEEAYSGELADAGNVSPGDMLKIILGVLTVVVAVCVAVASFGTLSWASVGAVVGSLKLIGGVVLFSTVGTLAIVSGTKGAISGFKGEFDLPMIRYTPYEIFSNQIPLLDVNFIKPMDSIVEEVTGGPVIKVHLDDGWAWSHENLTAEEVAISCTSGGEKKWNKRVHEEVDYQYPSDSDKRKGEWTKDDTTILEWWIEENKKYYRLTFENKNDVDNNTSYMWHLDEYTIPNETAEPELGIYNTYTLYWGSVYGKQNVNQVLWDCELTVTITGIPGSEYNVDCGNIIIDCMGSNFNYVQKQLLWGRPKNSNLGDLTRDPLEIAKDCANYFETKEIFWSDLRSEM